MRPMHQVNKDVHMLEDDDAMVTWVIRGAIYALLCGFISVLGAVLQ